MKELTRLQAARIISGKTDTNTTVHNVESMLEDGVLVNLLPCTIETHCKQRAFEALALKEKGYSRWLSEPRGQHCATINRAYL